MLLASKKFFDPLLNPRKKFKFSAFTASIEIDSWRIVKPLAFIASIIFVHLRFIKIIGRRRVSYSQQININLRV